MIKLAIDAMGGDFAPKEQVEGAMLAVKNIPDIELTLYGDETEIRKYLTNEERIKIVQSEGTIDMGEKDPIRAIRSNRNSSMALALSSVRSKDNDGVVCSGATQALIAGAHILIGRLKAMKRTAIAPLIPTVDGGSYILIDAGANISITPDYMLMQAMFAAIYAQEVQGKKNPTVGLINIGTEPGKGRELEQEVYKLFSDTPHFEFIGNVEPKEILDPKCDILISDGFTADIIMKCIEGTAKGMGKILRQEITKGFMGKIGSLILKSRLGKFKSRLSAEDIGGAMIYGLKGVVVKAQGSSKAYGFSRGIHQAATIVRNDVLSKIQAKLEQ